MSKQYAVEVCSMGILTRPVTLEYELQLDQQDGQHSIISL